MAAPVSFSRSLCHAPPVEFNRAATNHKMRGIRLRSKQPPILAACHRWKHTKHAALTETECRRTELIGVHTLYDEGPFIGRRPPLQPSVLEVGPLFIVPILVEWRIVLNRLPQV